MGKTRVNNINLSNKTDGIFHIRNNTEIAIDTIIDVLYARGILNDVATLYIYDTIAEAQLETTAVVGTDIAFVKYYSGTNLINAFYDFVDPDGADGGTADGFEYHDSTAAGLFQLKLRVPEIIHAGMAGLGAGDSGTDETALWSRIENYLSEGGIVQFGPKHYYFNISPTQHNLTLRGCGRNVTFLNSFSASSSAWCIDLDIGAQATSKLPQSLVIEDMTIQGNGTANCLRRANCKSGGLRNVEFNSCATANQLESCFNLDDINVFFRNYDVGLIGTSGSVSNNNNFYGHHFFGGNATTDSVAIDETYLGQCTFNDPIFEGSGQMATMAIAGNQNIFIGPRWESCTPSGGSSPYVTLGGKGNKLITPMITLLVAELPDDSTFQIEVTGSDCAVEDAQISIPQRFIKFTTASKNCRASLITQNMANQSIETIVMDFGTNNKIIYNGNDEMVNREFTQTKGVRVNNYFIDSTDFSSVTLDGLSQSTLTGATSRQGPFKEGLIEQFDTPTGNRRWSQDIYTTLGSIGSNQLLAFSFWIKSLTTNGETISVLMGRDLTAAEAAPIDVEISDTVWTRVVEYHKADNSAYTTFIAGIKLGASSSGVLMYAPQFFPLASVSGGLLPALYPGGYVPTEGAANTKESPCYALNREHAITPANIQGVAGQFIGKILPAVDANNMVLTGWRNTVSGNPGTWVTQYVSTVSPAT